MNYLVLLISVCAMHLSVAMEIFPSHTCTSDDDCRKRLGVKWSHLKFKCCTTVVCNAEIFFYSVSSGCATEFNCKPQAKANGGAQFAARLHFDQWKPNEANLLGRCPETRKSYENVREGVTPIPPKPPGATDFKGPDYSDEKLEEDYCEGRCDRSGKDCCLQIRCKADRSPKLSFYKSQWKCVTGCRQLHQRRKGIDTFYFTPSAWQQTPEYQEEFLAPRVEGSCHETRYFYLYLDNKLRESRRRS